MCRVHHSRNRPDGISHCIFCGKDWAALQNIWFYMCLMTSLVRERVASYHRKLRRIMCSTGSLDSFNPLHFLFIPLSCNTEWSGWAHYCSPPSNLMAETPQPWRQHSDAFFIVCPLFCCSQSTLPPFLRLVYGVSVSLANTSDTARGWSCHCCCSLMPRQTLLVGPLHQRLCWAFFLFIFFTY